LVPVALLYAAALAIWFLYRSRLGHIGFYALFAIVVTQSVQLVGIYLVFTSLIVPALAARLYPERIRLGVGYGVGIAGYVSGLIASSVFDLPTGAVIVVTLVLAFAVATILARGTAVAPRRAETTA
jgi:zinc/manganese transport system permease protein